MRGIILKSFVFVILFGDFTFSFRMIYERANVTYVNDKYIVYAKMNVRRYCRRGYYYLNIEGQNKHTWANNITHHMVFHEFLHNEYRRSFIEFHYKLCDLLKKEPYAGGVFVAAGINCPFPAGLHRLMNLTAETMDNFPNVWPFEKGRVEWSLTITKTGETMVTGYLDALFINERKKPQQKLSNFRG